MADNVTLPGTGIIVATDDITTAQVQYVKLMDGTSASVEVITGTAANGLDVDVTRLPSLATGTNNIGDVDIASIAAGETHIGSAGGNTITITVTPTLSSTDAYVANDYIGSSSDAMTFTNAARVAGGSGVIQSAVMIDYATTDCVGELWMFDAEPTPPANSAAWSISDADSLKCIGVIEFNRYYDSALNSVSNAHNLGIAFTCAGGSRDLYGCFVTRGAPIYENGDISFRLTFLQD
jgi:hypothetical protein